MKYNASPDGGFDEHSPERITLVCRNALLVSVRRHKELHRPNGRGRVVDRLHDKAVVITKLAPCRRRDLRDGRIAMNSDCAVVCGATVAALTKAGLTWSAVLLVLPNKRLAQETCRKRETLTRAVGPLGGGPVSFRNWL